MLLKTKAGLGIVAVSTLWVACAADADPASPGQHASQSNTVNSPDREASPSIKVSFRDLDLHRPGDVARLYRRLNAAADQLCGSRAFNIFYYTLPQYQACVDDSVQKAIAHIKQPGLTAYYRQQLVRPDAGPAAEQ